MNIADIAECLSAFAAFFTVCLAVAELTSRSKIKKADVAMEIYADYLHIKQQVEYVIGSIESLAEKIEGRSVSEIQTYAKTHLVNKSLFSDINIIKKKTICSIDYSAKNEEFGKKNSKQILVFSGGVHNLMISANTFYRALITADYISSDFIAEHSERIMNSYNSLVPEIITTGEMLHLNLIKTHKYSNTYLFLLIAFTVFFCIIVSVL